MMTRVLILLISPRGNLYGPGSLTLGGVGGWQRAGGALLWTRANQRRTLRSVPYMTGKIEGDPLLDGLPRRPSCLGKDAGARGGSV
jgi:hypothetical protein